MGNFADELGRWHYTVETDVDSVTYEAAVYDEKTKEQVRKKLLQLDGVYSDTLRWVPGHASRR